LVQAVTNTPRIEYDAGGSCLGLLMEASRTNLALQSQDLATTWTVSGATASANSVAAPDGTTTADTLVESSGGTFHLVRQDVTITANSAYTFSVFVKAAGRTACKLQVSNTLENTGANADFDLTAVTASNVTNFGTGASSAATITAYANGWYRISLRTTIDAASTTGRIQLLLANPAGTTSYSGDGASGMYMWGMQYELGQFMSSYIPTTTIAVARTADSCIRTLSTEYSATAGTVVVQGRASGGQDTAQQYVYEFGDGTGNESTRLQRQANTDLCRVNVVDGGVAQSGALTDFTFVNSTAFKHSLSWSVNDLAASLNGAAVTTDAVATIPTTTSLGLGISTFGLPANGHIRRFDYYPTRLSNAFLQLASA
ncbi:MAG: hypothetical protein EBR82_40960, partial [Caulobacteraceae bacterium]|nr:hypothetical protein [Caulobacteraceae bacterium]